MFLNSSKIKPKNPSKNWHKTAKYYGIIPRIIETFVNVQESQYQEDLKRILITRTCPVCHGARLNEEVLSAKIKGKSIADCSDMDISSFYEFIDGIKEDKVKEIIKALKEKLTSLSLVGLDYLKLNQGTTSLSGGESQRIKWLNA